MGGMGLRLEGKRFGKLTAIEPVGKDNHGRIKWRCMCDCGGERVTIGPILKRGESSSCGCAKGEGRVRDIEGKRFGKLVVVAKSAVFRKGRGRKWECLCDCGTRLTLLAARLLSGGKVDCGCGKRTKRDRTLRAKSVVDKTLTPFNQKIAAYRCGARKRGLEWLLTKEEAIALFRSPCHYCGSAPGSPTRASKYLKPELSNGIDRVDSALNYENFNCVASCSQCNLAKMDYSKQDFLAWVSRIAQHQGFTTYNPPPTQEDNTMKWAVH